MTTQKPSGDLEIEARIATDPNDDTHEKDTSMNTNPESTPATPMHDVTSHEVPAGERLSHAQTHLHELTEGVSNAYDVFHAALDRVDAFIALPGGRCAFRRSGDIITRQAERAPKLLARFAALEATRASKASADEGDCARA